MNSRNISKESINYTLDYGTCYRDRKREVFRLDKKAISKAKLKGLDIGQHEGVHVVLDDDGLVITVYRHKEGKKIRRGHFYRRSRKY